MTNTTAKNTYTDLLEKYLTAVIDYEKCDAKHLSYYGKVCDNARKTLDNFVETYLKRTL
jgi:hypothetical protein